MIVYKGNKMLFKEYFLNESNSNPFEGAEEKKN